MKHSFLALFGLIDILKGILLNSTLYMLSIKVGLRKKEHLLVM